MSADILREMLVHDVPVVIGSPDPARVEALERILLKVIEELQPCWAEIEKAICISNTRMDIFSHFRSNGEIRTKLINIYAIQKYIRELGSAPQYIQYSDIEY